MAFLTLSDLRSKLGGRGRSSIYRDVEAGRLPPPIKLGGRLLWAEDKVDRALEDLADGSRAKDAQAGLARVQP